MILTEKQLKQQVGCIDRYVVAKDHKIITRHCRSFKVTLVKLELILLSLCHTPCDFKPLLSFWVSVRTLNRTKCFSPSLIRYPMQANMLKTGTNMIFLFVFYITRSCKSIVASLFPQFC